MMYVFCNYLVVLTKFENFLRFVWLEDRSYEFVGDEKTICIGIGRVSRETTFDFRMH
jgi:hypothetical protein